MQKFCKPSKQSVKTLCEYRVKHLLTVRVECYNTEKVQRSHKGHTKQTTKKQNGHQKQNGNQTNNMQQNRESPSRNFDPPPSTHFIHLCTIEIRHLV